MRIYLDDDDCPDTRDRETAARIIEEIALNDVVTRGSWTNPAGDLDTRAVRKIDKRRDHSSGHSRNDVFHC